MSTPTPSQKIQQYVDNQQFDIAYQVLVEEQEKLFEADINEEELRERGLELIGAYRLVADAVHEKKLDAENALNYLQHAREVCKAIWDKPTLKSIELDNDVAFVHTDLRQFEEARTIYKSIIPLAYLHRNPDGVKTEVYHNIASTYEMEGECKEALHYYEQSRIVLDKAAQHEPETDISENLAANYNNKARTLIGLKEYEAAQANIKKGLEVVNKKTPRYCKLLIHDALCYRYTGDYKSALSVFKKATNLSENNVHLKCRILLGVSETYADMQRYEKAIAKASEVIQLLESSPWNPILPRAYKATAELYLQTRKYDKAYEFAEKSFRGTRVDSQKVEILDIKAKIQTANYLLDKNVSHLNEIITILLDADITIDKVRRNYKNQTSRLLLAEQAKDIYERGIETAFLLYKKTNDKEYVKIAFRYAEKSKAILLLMEIKHQDGMLSAGVRPEVLQREKEILRRLNYLDKMLNGERKLPETAEQRLKKEHFELQREHETFLQKLEQDYPDYYQQKYNTEPTSIADLQEKLSDKRLIVSYFVGEKNTYIFQINKKYADMENIGKTVSIRRQVMDFRGLLEKRVMMPLPFEQQAVALYDTLLKSTLKHSQADQLLIVPDDVLTQLPFEALVAQRIDNNLNFKELNYLLNDYEVVYHFSATLWHYGLKKYERQQRDLSFVGFAPIYEGEVQPEQVESKHYERDFTFRNKVCHKLPFAKQEVEQISSFFEQKKLCVDALATKDNFVTYCTQGTYLHIAAHGFYSKEKNEDCYIQFSPSEKDDIRLTINDIASLKIDAHLIVLSCCNTGQGQFRKGESVFALNRSFMAAGGQNVISTLFKIPDALACELMTDMYEKHLNEQRNVSPSLRYAKLQLIRKEGITPKMWCGYQLVGS